MLGRDPRVAGVEAGAEFLEQLSLAERKFSGAAGPPHLVARDRLARCQQDPNLVENRRARNLRVVVFVGLDLDPAHQRLHVGPADEIRR